LRVEKEGTGLHTKPNLSRWMLELELDLKKCSTSSDWRRSWTAKQSSFASSLEAARRKQCYKNINTKRFSFKKILKVIRF